MEAEIHIGSERCGQSTKGKRLKFYVLINHKIFFRVGNILAHKSVATCKKSLESTLTYYILTKIGIFAKK